MRTIGRNELTIQDPYSGSEITIYYKIPTTTQRILFASLASGDMKMLEYYVAVGREVITGYPAGQFGIDDHDGVTKQIDSIPSSSFFDKNWKEEIFPASGESNEDILAALGKWVLGCLVKISNTGESKKKTGEKLPLKEISLSSENTKNMGAAPKKEK